MAVAQPRVMVVTDEIQNPPTAPAAAEEDRISNLSDDILVSIISRLPVRQLLRTALLSRRWRGLCALAPHLDFSTESSPEAGLCLLLLRNTAAHLKISLMRRIPIPAKNWIHHLTPTIKKLTLSVLPTGPLDDILSIPTLEELILYDYRFPYNCLPPTDVVSGLRSLQVYHVRAFQTQLQALINVTPLLDRLVLSDVALLGSDRLLIRSEVMTLLEIEFMDLVSLQIDAPVLTTLMLNTLDQLKDINLTVPSLSIFNVATTSTHNNGRNRECPNYRSIHRGRYKKNNVDIVDKICWNNPSNDAIKSQEMGEWYKFYDFCGPPINQLPMIPHRIDIFVALRKFFVDMDLCKYKNVLLLALVLDKCTNLQELGIDIPDFTEWSACQRTVHMGMNQNYDDNHLKLVSCSSTPTAFQRCNDTDKDLVGGPPKSSYWRMDNKFSCLDHHLEHIWIKGFAGLHLEFEFITFVLSKAAVLKSLVISYNTYCSDDTLEALKLIQPRNSDLHITTKFKACWGRLPTCFLIPFKCPIFHIK